MTRCIQPGCAREADGDRELRLCRGCQRVVDYLAASASVFVRAPGVPGVGDDRGRQVGDAPGGIDDLSIGGPATYTAEVTT